MSELHVKGLADIQKFLDQLPAKIEKNIMRGALRAGVKKIKEHAYKNCPVGPPSGESRRLYNAYEGTTRDSIRIRTRSKSGRVSASVIAGGKNPKTGANISWVHMLEYTGAVSHFIKARKGSALNVNGQQVSKVNHPGMSAQPFMRPALDAMAGAAVVEAGNYIKKRLATKNGINTADIKIGEDE